MGNGRTDIGQMNRGRRFAFLARHREHIEQPATDSKWPVVS